MNDWIIGGICALILIYVLVRDAIENDERRKLLRRLREETVDFLHRAAYDAANCVEKNKPHCDACYHDSLAIKDVATWVESYWFSIIVEKALTPKKSEVNEHATQSIRSGSNALVGYCSRLWRGWNNRQHE